MARRQSAARRRARRDLWGGRFTEPPSDLLRRFNDSFSFDRELLAQELLASAAWAEALGRAGVLAPREVARLRRALREVEAPAADDPDHEDVHSYVEAALARRLGALAGKLHTGRSRNDQVATDLRLFLREAFDDARGLTLGLAAALAARAAAEAGAAMPGYTHMKGAEPITFGHWCLAYVEMLLRDAERLAQARRRGDQCPLGSGALAGTPLRIDRRALARSLGFREPTANSLDAVADRDTAADYLFTGGLLLIHLSRLSEDLIAFSSDEFAFVELPDALATGSSRMPHKKNPDLLELTRGHAARAIGDLAGLLALMKGLPLAYNKDLQLDKEPVFRLRRTLASAMPALTSIIERLSLDRDRMRRAASDDRLLATALADALASRGIPFREAHEIAGRRMVQAMSSGRRLIEMGPGGAIAARDLQAMTVEACLANRSSAGGTAPERVRAAALAARRRIAKLGRQTP